MTCAIQQYSSLYVSGKAPSNILYVSADLHDYSVEYEPVIKDFLAFQSPLASVGCRIPI